MDDYKEEDYPKDNTRNKDKKLKILLTNENKNNSENIKIVEKAKKEKEDSPELKMKSLTKNNSFIEKDISPIKLITNTQESINIMENIENLNLDKNIFTNNEEIINKIEVGYKNKKKEFNKDNIIYKKKTMENELIRENIELSDKEEERNEKKLNKTSVNLSSSNNFNLNDEHQDTIPLSKYLNSNNLKNSCQDSDSDSNSDFNIIRNSENDINLIENNKRKKQEIFSINSEVKDCDNNKNKYMDNSEISNTLEEKYNNIHNEIFNLIGEKDYTDIMNIYSQIKDKTKFRTELEIFVKDKNYIDIKKEKLMNLFLSLMSIEDKSE